MSSAPALSLPPTLAIDATLPIASFGAALARLRRSVKYHAHTALLFTMADLKTILVPITMFACATAPLHSTVRLLPAMSWIWLHQLMCNVSNQARSSAEDAVNKPWRPLPSGRLTERQATALRWTVVGLCLCYSATYGPDLALTTLGLVVTTLLYDELGLSGHYVGKSFCNIGGYTTLEIGATKLMGTARDVDSVSATAICLSGVLIFTTIQAQDFADVEGDSALGRQTFPIRAPRLARAATLLAISGWSLFLAWFWDVGALCGAAFVGLGAFVALRYFLLRTPEEDKASYVFYNVWLTFAHIMPIRARIAAFAS